MDGMRKLGNAIELDERLNDVKLVAMTSPLVRQYPGIIEGLGFQVDYADADPLGRLLRAKYAEKKIKRSLRQSSDDGFACMARTEFLNRYGTKLRSAGQKEM